MTVVKVNEAQPGWYQVDLSTMTSGSGTLAIKEGGKTLAQLSGGGVRQTHGEKMFQAERGELTIDVPGHRALIHGPFIVADPADEERILSKTWVVSSEDSTDNDFNDYTSRLTWFKSAG